MVPTTCRILFLLNRYCILNEVWRLVADGILNVEDIDNVMSEGLGMRYAFLGPLETAHLNAEGMRKLFFTPCPPYRSNSDPLSLLNSVNLVKAKEVETTHKHYDSTVTSPCPLAKGLNFSHIFLPQG
jgi:hypothetical protein